MQCPFLRKTSVKFCGLCRLTMIPLDGNVGLPEQCSGPDYRKCPLVRDRNLDQPQEARCPFLSVGDVHSCAAAPVQKQIPCNLTTQSRCTNEGHAYCQLFLSMTETGAASPPIAETEANSQDRGAAIPMPASLAYAPNHMWFDPGNGTTWHVGVDAFFGRALGQVDEIIFPHHGNDRRPMVRIRAGGVDFDLAFPNVIQPMEINTHLVADPSGILTDPYGRGWMFEGATLPKGSGRDPVAYAKTLRQGDAATLWMQEEWERLDHFVREHLGRTPGAANLDPCEPLSAVLDRPTLMRLHTEFFTFSSKRTVA